MAIDPATVTKALQEIKADAAKYNAIIALASELGTLTDLHNEIEAAKHQLAIVQNGEDQVRSKYNQMEKDAQTRAEGIKGEADKYSEARRSEGEAIVANAKAQADQISAAKKKEAEEVLAHHQQQIGPLVREKENLEKVRSELILQVTRLQAKVQELEHKVSAVRDEHVQLTTKHAEFLHNIGVNFANR